MSRPRETASDPSELLLTVWGRILVWYDLSRNPPRRTVLLAYDFLMAKTCPDCGVALVTKTIHNIEVDLCPTCGGMWLDKGEIARLRRLGSKDIKDFEQPVAQSPERSAVRHSNPGCPICGAVLQEFHYANGPVVMESCPNLDGLWVTAQELDRFATTCDMSPAVRNAVIEMALDSQSQVDHHQRAAGFLRAVDMYRGWRDFGC